MWTRGVVVGLLLTAGCLEDVEVPPKAPVLFAVASPTTVAVQKLKGTRPANTAVLLNDQVVAASAEDTGFAFDVVLQPGVNTFNLKTQRASGLKSKGVTVATILYEPACPPAVTLTAQPPAATNQRMHTLAGTKPKGTAVFLDGAVIVAASDATTFTHALTLPPAEATYAFSVTARDAKGHDSDPVRFTTVYDVTPPALLARYPDPGATGIPTNASVFVAFTEPVRTTAPSLPADVITVTQGATPVTGTTASQPTAAAMVWAGAFAPSVVQTAKLDPATLTDLAGNPVPAGAQWTWTFTTAATGSATVPANPSAMTATPSTATPDVTITGTRDVATAIYVNGDLTVIPGPASWSAKVPLAVGPNALTVTARSAAGVPSAGAAVVPVTRTVNRPAAPTLDAATPKTVTEGRLAVTGTKPAGTSVLLNGTPIACLDDQTSWGAAVTLDPGFNDLKLTTRDSDGNESDPLVFTVNFSQGYSGKVPSGWQLKVSMTLRDLRGTRLANEFVTGPNNYGVDVWLEGPIAAGEVCEFDAVKKQRKNVKYVATIEHYLGVKTGHTVPFADDDYRGTDYVAALASGGMLSFLGITADTPRRDGNGREVAGLLGAIKESDLRSKIDCFGLLGIDGCTEATVGAGTHVIEPWVPKRPPNATLIDQGDYLLWVQINLDRGGTWLTANDTETCWAQPADFSKGMHRIVRRVALGGSAWSVKLTPGDEVSGPDSDGTGEAKFLAAEGMTVSWGPP